jgi:hypothetical protein
MKINCHTDFQPLKEIILGQVYNPLSFEFHTDKKIREPMRRILEETVEDLNVIQEVLEQYDVTVYRPEQPDATIVESFVIDDCRPPPPPLAVRDRYMALGNTLYRFDDSVYLDNIFKEASINNSIFDPYNRNENLPPINKDDLLNLISSLNKSDAYTKHNSKFSKDSYLLNIGTHLLEAPLIVRLGNRLIVDVLTPYQMEWCKDQFNDYEIFNTNIRGHSDGCFCPIKPGLNLHTKNWISDYKKSTPGWGGIFLKNQGYESHMVKKFEKNKLVNGKWWLNNEENNTQLRSYVNTWLDNWVGQINETVFDVNLLSINENLVLCMNEPPPSVKNAFKRYNVEYQIVPFRHRFFWDGGLHCITVDLYREGARLDYFN